MGGMTRRGCLGAIAAISGSVLLPIPADSSTGLASVEWQYDLFEMGAHLAVTAIITKPDGAVVRRATRMAVPFGPEARCYSVGDVMRLYPDRIKEAQGTIALWAESKGIKWAA